MQVRTGRGSYGSSVSLTFSASPCAGRYDTDQTVNMPAGTDTDLDGDDDGASLSFTISGGSDYNAVTHGAISVSVGDNDPKGITQSKSSLSVSEDAAPASYT